MKLCGWVEVGVWQSRYAKSWYFNSLSVATWFCRGVSSRQLCDFNAQRACGVTMVSHAPLPLKRRLGPVPAAACRAVFTQGSGPIQNCSTIPKFCAICMTSEERIEDIQVIFLLTEPKEFLLECSFEFHNPPNIYPVTPTDLGASIQGYQGSGQTYKQDFVLIFRVTIVNWRAVSNFSFPSSKASRQLTVVMVETM